MPQISVVIPAYNAARFIQKSISSALEQTFRDREVIVVNDGSVDSTVNELRPFRKRIHYVEQSNKGPAAARNAGISNATGKYIAFLDADDWWMPSRLTQMIRYLEVNPDVGFATSDAFLVYGETISTRTYYQSIPRRQRFRHWNQDLWISRCNFIFTMTVVRRELFDRHGIFDEGIRGTEDWDLWLRFILEGERAGLVEAPLAYYRFHREGISFDRIESIPEELAVIEKAAARYGQRVTELDGRVRLLKGKLALSRGEYEAAKENLSHAARDTSLDALTRIKAATAASMPVLGRRLYSRHVTKRGF